MSGFITVTILSDKGQKRVADIVASKLFAVGKSESLGATVIIADGGATFLVDESVEIIKQQITQAMSPTVL
jgi:hypothetical protein